MKYTPPLGEVENASYTDGNPEHGILGSVVPAKAVESPQREIEAVIREAGLTPSDNDLTQLLQAIVKIIGIKVPLAKVGTPGIVSPDGKTCKVDSEGVLSIPLALAARAGLVKPDGATIIIKADGTISAMSKYDLCEFYYFRHPTLRPGFQPAQGGLLANAATLYPEAWAYLQTTEGKKLCKTEAEWQAMTTATWATLADGTQVGWNGIGGAPYYAPNTATGALRLPDLRGMYAEAAGYDALGVGAVHGDGTRRLQGWLPGYLTSTSGSPQAASNSVLYWGTTGSRVYEMGTALDGRDQLSIDSQRTVPTASKNQPRAWGALACVYLGLPSS